MLYNAAIVSLCLCACLLCLPARADDTATQQDRYGHAAYTALLIADWLQTREIARNPKQFYEGNPVMGAHPSVSDVDRYFLASAAVYFLAQRLLPRRYAACHQRLSLQLEFSCVASNYAIGIRF